MNREVVNILVGAAVVVVGIFVILVSSSGGPKKLVDGYEVFATYGGIDGVGVGTEVLLAGVKVGSVTGKVYEHDGHQATISMAIDNRYQLPIDSVAMIVSKGMLGGKLIKLDPGGEEEMMKSGDAFEYTQDSILFEELLEKIVLDAEARRDKRKKEKKERKARQEGEKPEPKKNPFGSLLK